MNVNLIVFETCLLSKLNLEFSMTFTNLLLFFSIVLLLHQYFERKFNRQKNKDYVLQKITAVNIIYLHFLLISSQINHRGVIMLLHIQMPSFI